MECDFEGVGEPQRKEIVEDGLREKDSILGEHTRR
jgi:hypothetical protein